MKAILHENHPTPILEFKNLKWLAFSQITKLYRSGIIMLCGVMSLFAFNEANAQTMSISSSPPHTLNTYYTANGGGVTFNLHAYNSVKITGLTATTQGSGSVTYELWYNTDSVNGSPNISTSNNWVVHETGTATPGQIVTLNKPLNIPMGKTYGIFFRSITESVQYSNSPTLPSIFQDANLRLNVGSLVGYSGEPPNPPYHIRSYAGTIQYEFRVNGHNNAGVSAIDSPSNYCPGNHNIIATISNQGSNQLDSVRIQWSFNGNFQGTIPYTSLLDTLGGSGNSSAQVVLGNKYFAGGQNYTIKAWTSHPNGGVDTVNGNDTLSETLTNLPNCPLPRDVGATRIKTPEAYGCGTSDTTEVCVVVYNYGLDPQDSIQVSYRIFNIVVATETVPGTLKAGDSITYCFQKRADLSLPTLYPFSAWATLPGDMKPGNDTIPGFYTVQSDTVFTSFPYLTTFEETPGALPPYWNNDPDDGTENWEFDIINYPTPTGIPYDHTLGTSQGNYAWIDNSYPNQFEINLRTPCLNLSGIVNPALEFYYFNPDLSSSIQLYVDVFSGGQWIQIAGPLGYQDMNNWEYHLYDLKQFANETVKVRFRASEGSAYDPDIAIDDVKIFNLPPINVGIPELITPETSCDLTDIEKVKIKVEQRGYDTLFPNDTVWAYYTINNGPVNAEMVVMTDTVEQFEFFTHEFATFADLSQPGGIYDFKLWASHPLDDDFTNDTLEVTIENTLVTSYPDRETFDSYEPNADGMNFEGRWENDPSGPTDNYRWNLGSVAAHYDAPKGDHTSGYGVYAYTMATYSSSGDTAFLYNRSCYDLSVLSNPGLNFWYSMPGNNVGTLYLDVLDNGQWITVWSETGYQGEGWHRAIVGLNNYAGQTVSFRFRGMKTGTYDNVIGVDDWIIGELPKIGLSDTVLDCGSTVLNAKNPGSEYGWSNGSTMQKITVMAHPTDTITKKYSVGVMNQSGLYNRDTTTVILTPGPHLELGVDTLICGGSSLDLDAGNPGMNYVWDDGSNNQTRTVTQDGQYYVAVSSAGCVKADTIDVQFEAIPVAALADSQAAHSNLVHFSSNGSTGTTYFWDFGDNNFSNSPNPDNFYTQKGDYDVMLIVTNDCGSDTITQTVTVVHQPGVGIDLPVSIQEVKIYPNPTDGQFMLELKTDRLKEMGITILNINGQEVLSERYRQIERDFSQRYDLSDLAKGVYFIRIHTADGVVTEKIIIQ